MTREGSLFTFPLLHEGRCGVGMPAPSPFSNERCGSRTEPERIHSVNLEGTKSTPKLKRVRRDRRNSRRSRTRGRLCHSSQFQFRQQSAIQTDNESDKRHFHYL